MVLTFIIAFLICRYKIPQIFGKYDLKDDKKKRARKDLFSYSWPLLFFGIISSLFYWIDSFAIGYFKGAFEVGLYNAAVPIAALLYFSSNIFIQMFFPLITKEFAKKNFILIGELSKQVTKWIFIINLPILIIMILFPGAILNILFGQEYMIAKEALRFLAIGAFISSTLFISNNILSMLGKSKLILVDIIISSIFNVLLNVLLVPKYGIEGAAFSTMISYIILSLLFFLQAKYYSSIIPFRRKILRILIIAAIPAIVLYYSRSILPYNIPMLILEGLMFCFLYILLILITGCLDKNDLMIINLLKSKLVRNKPSS
jgi:O-antigen/teichoic acid export membrane protein